MTPLTLEELVAFFFLSQPAGEQRFTEPDFVRLVEEIGVERANEYRQLIVQQLHQGHNLHVITVITAA
ncbi:hypothetical protein [Deinococcus hopiensis]|uniref:Uncharacterized protein n=1 Tax=Deinococcus hopiensis KR-140 TaxID=695939 RepID=A0A1W1URS1_9DEIO|nr:hypothetical protein [Deinococcus hopiensis]SMB83770.1 hypothetical protein SAMN00790413_04883 [Deinococcus hopiensis KR-140]